MFLFRALELWMRILDGTGLRFGVLDLPDPGLIVNVATSPFTSKRSLYSIATVTVVNQMMAAKARIVVVAGGTGFFGSHLARFYHNHDFHVRIVDIKPPKHGIHKYYTESVPGNLCDLDFCSYAVRGAEIVLHCARTSADDSHSDDGERTYYRTNYIITQNLLAASCQAGVKTFFYPSTHTDTQLRLLRDHVQETDSPTHSGLGTRGLCNLEKLHSEQLALAYSNRMTIRITRFCHIYGSTKAWDESDDYGPATLLQRVLAAKHLVDLGIRPRLEISGDAVCKRQFTYIDDAVKAVASFIESEGERPISNLELTSLVLNTVALDLSDVDRAHNGGAFKFDNIDSSSSLGSTSSSKPLTSYQQGLAQLHDWMGTKMQAALLSQSPEDRQSYLMSLLSRTSTDHKIDNLIKFAVILPLPSQLELDAMVDNLHRFACSLKDVSWRDRNELGAIRYDLYIYLVIDIENEFFFPSSSQPESRAQLILWEHGFSRVFVIPYCLQEGSPGTALNQAARRAYADQCDYYTVMNHNTELLDEGWMRIVHAKFQAISIDSGGPGGFGCVAFTYFTQPGTPVPLVTHRTHLDIFEGQLIPEELEGQDDSVYLFQLYRHFGGAATVPIRVRGPSIIHNEEKGSPDWTYDTFEDNKNRIRVWAKRNSLNIRSKMSLDIIIPSYRVSLERLSNVLALEPSPSCITTFIIVVDNPQSPYVYELQHSNCHRTDVLILVNESNQGASASRNRGLAMSTAEWVAFLDDDVDPSPSYLVSAEKYIRAQPAAAGFVGNVYFPPAHNIFTAAIRLSGVTFFWDIADKIPEDVPWGITANLIVRRNIRDQVKFDLRFPKTGGGEDIDFCVNKRKASLEQNGTGFSAAPEVIATHPWWNNGRRSYSRFFNWARGDGALIKMHPDLSWRDATPNSAETFLLAILSLFAGVLSFNWSVIRFAISLAISNLSAHVLHDTHRHLVRQKPQLDKAQTSLGQMGWILAIFEGAVIRMASEMGRLVGVLERKEWASIGKRFDWFNGGPWGVTEERSGGIERAILVIGFCTILLMVT